MQNKKPNLKLLAVEFDDLNQVIAVFNMQSNPILTGERLQEFIEAQRHLIEDMFNCRCVTEEQYLNELEEQCLG